MQSILLPNAIVTNSKVTSKKRLFREIALLGAELFDLPNELLQELLQQREDLGPTGMGKGIAIPHARVDGLNDVRGIFIKLEEPLDFDAADHQPVDLVFALLAPANSGAEHLKALAKVSRVLRDADIAMQLRSTDSMEAIYAVLTRPGNSVAA